MNIKATLSALILSVSVSLYALEESVTRDIVHFENLENLPAQKYTHCQYEKIAQVLNQKENKIRVVSYNMLFNLYDHNLAECHRWPQRLPRIADLLETVQADVIGAQELYKSQLDDLIPILECRYNFIAKPCEDGELNGIFYRKDRFELVDTKIWYMTSTPHIPSSETLTMVVLKDRKTGKCFSVLNTHLAFSKIQKREFQACFIANILKEIPLPIIFMGDLNTFPQRLDLSDLPFYDGDYIHSILATAPIVNAKERSLLGHLGPISTFTNVEGSGKAFRGTGTPGVFLDHIYVSKDICVLIHAVESGKVNGHFPSDHMPVISDLII